MFLLKVIFAIFIILFPLGEVARIQFLNGVAFTVNDFLLLLLILCWIVLNYSKKLNFKNNLLTKPIFIFLIVALMSLLINFANLTFNQFLFSLLYLVRFAAYASLYFIVKKFDTKFKIKISYLMLISGFNVVLLGFIQYLIYPNLRNLYYLGWDDHLYRMFSTFLDPNFAGAFFVLYFIFTINFIRNISAKKQLIKQALLSFTALLSVIAVYLTYSRSALIMLIISVSAYLLLLKKKLILFFVLLILIFSIFISPKAFQTEGTNLLRTLSSFERIKSAQIALKIFTQNPILGVGFNAYRYAQNRLGSESGTYWQVSHSGAGTDNSFLFVLATTGVIGLAAYLYLQFRIGMMGIKKIKQNKLAIVLLSSLLGLLINSLFLNSLFYVFIIEWIWIIAGLSETN